MQDFFYTEPADYTMSTGTGLELLGSLVVTPTKYEKFIIFTSGDLVEEGSPASGYSQQVFSEVTLELNGSGTPIAQFGGAGQHCNFILPFETILGHSTTIELFGHAQINDVVKNLRIMAIGVPDWYVFKGSSTEVTTSSHIEQTIAERSIYPDFGDTLIFSYIEAGADITGTGDGNRRARVRLYLNDASNKETLLLDNTTHAVAAITNDNTGFDAFSGVHRVNLPKDLTRIKWSFNRVSGSGPIVARRYNTILVPVHGLPFGDVKSTEFNNPRVLDYNTVLPDLKINSKAFHNLPAGVTSVLMSYMSTSVKTLNRAASNLVKYTFADTTGVTVGNTIHVNSAAEGTGDRFTEGQNRVVFKAVNPTEAQVDGDNYFSSDYAPVSPAGYTGGGPTPPGLTNGDRVVLDNTSFHTISFRDSQAVPGITPTANSIQNTYSGRTLIEIYKRETVTRYALEDDVFLFTDSTPAEVIGYYQAGLIDRASLIDLTREGEIAADALDVGDTARAINALENLVQPVVDPSGSTDPSEYDAISNYRSLYQRGVVKDVTINEGSDDPLLGLSTNRSATVVLNNLDGLVTVILNDAIENYQHSIIKIRHYDPVNNELKSIFSGRITDFSGFDTVTIKAINPESDILQEDYAKRAVLDLTSEELLENEQSPDNPAALVPVFFGKVKRMPLHHVHKEFGTNTFTPNLIDAYSDYSIGGPVFNTTFPYVVAITADTSTGVYRDFVGVTNEGEFDNTNKANRFIQLNEVADQVESTDAALATDLRALALEIEVPSGKSVGTLGIQVFLLGFVSLGKKLLAEAVGVEQPFGDDGDLSFNIVSNSYLLNGGVSPTLRFNSTVIDTPTRNNGLGMPRTAGVSLDNFTLSYPTYAPISEINHIDQFIKGQDYVDYEISSGLVGVKWVGTTSPADATSGTVVVGITRSTGTDYILANEPNSAYAQVLTINGITKGGRTYDKGIHFSTISSIPNRGLEDIIDWSPLPLTVADINIQQKVVLDLGTNNLTLLDEGSQPLTGGGGTYLDFTADSEGRLYTNAGADDLLFQAGVTAGYKSIRLLVDVSYNGNQELSGFVAGKANITGATSGYFIEVLDEVSAGVPGGDPTKVIALSSVANGSLVSRIVGTSKLNDGAKHTIELRFDNLNLDGTLTHFLIVDGIEEGNDGTGGSYDLDADGAFSIGRHPSQAAGFLPFKGRIYRVRMSNDTMGEPTIGQAYSANIDYKSDTYNASYTYLNRTASNPIQNLAGAGHVIAGDFKVAGSDIVPLSVEGTISVLGVTAGRWVRGPGNLGYMLSLNDDPSILNNVWELGAGALGSTTILADSAAMAGDAEVSIPHDDAFRMLGDFTLYGAASAGASIIGQSAVLVGKHFIGTGSLFSYAIGINSGRPWATVAGKGGFYELNGISPIDDGNIHVISVERSGGMMNLYVDGSLEASRTISPAGDTTEYTTHPIVVGSTRQFGNRWSGGIAFVGLASFAGGVEFNKYLTDMLSKGIKGGFAEKAGGNTIFHIPFTEGTGATVKSRNLHRNFAYGIKSILTDRTIGLSQAVDALTFDTVMTTLDDLDIKCDFNTQVQRPVVDILNDLLVVRGMKLSRNTAGLWSITVDEPITEVKASFGYNDGYYNNIGSVDSYKINSTDRVVKELNLEYNVFSDTTGTLVPHSSVKRSVLPFGVESNTMVNPYIFDHTTADKVVDYLSKKLRFANKTLVMTVGQEGRHLQANDVVELTIARLGFYKRFFRITGIEKSIGKNVLTLHEYSEDLYTYNKGAINKDITIATEAS